MYIIIIISSRLVYIHLQDSQSCQDNGQVILLMLKILRRPYKIYVYIQDIYIYAYKGY